MNSPTLTVQSGASVRWQIFGILLAGLAIAMWSFASPRGSSPDEFYHVGSAWCIYGESDNCKYSQFTTDYYPQWAEVPFSVDGCFVPFTEDSAECQSEDHPATQVLPIDNARNLYPPTFHVALSFFLEFGPDIGIPLMRIFNGLLGVGLLMLAMHVSEERVRVAVLSSFLIFLVPQGVFLLSSINPTSWAFTATSLNWAFLCSVLSQDSSRDSHTRSLAFIGLIVTLVMSTVRHDTLVFVILLSVGAMSFSTPIKLHLKRSALPTALVGIVIVGISFALSGRFIIDTLLQQFKADNSWSFARYWIVHFLEIPLTSMGLNYGVYSSIGAKTPPLVGHIQFGLLFAFLVFSMLTKSTRQRIFVAIFLLTLYFVILQQNALDGETGFYLVQGRYFLPFMTGGIGIAIALSSNKSQLIQYLTIRKLLIGLISLSHMLSLFSLVRRYSNGSDLDYERFESDVHKNFAIPDGWRYVDWVSPFFIVLVGSLAYVGLVWFLLRSCDDQSSRLQTSNAPR